MRYLNKIVFINSASVYYAEVNIDGNVHFIGTQGVGKSTLLRAILFFYNADKGKLGIEKGKRSFDEYYFPAANSYVVYEVLRETGPFCVLAFKSQGRVAFRFVDGAYEQSFFIGPDFRARTWEQIREALPAHRSSTRKIDRYEEYRDILYGNNKGLPAEFRRYALLESRQYKNLPRTIQNVFLNARLEAEFIKQTIIMSLNEEDVKIDLDQYALHLRGFEEQLADIGKWSTRSRGGEIAVRVLAAKIAQNYTAVRYLEKEKASLAAALLAAHQQVEQALPGALRQKQQEAEKLEAATKKVNEADARFQEKKYKISNEIALQEARLREARRKQENYDRLQIHSLIARVAKKGDWERQRLALQQEAHLLSARFREITSKYEALQAQVQIQLEGFINATNQEKNTRTQAFYAFRDGEDSKYAQILEGLENEGRELLQASANAIEEKASRLHALELHQKEVELKRYFSAEIDQARQQQEKARQLQHAAGLDIAGWKKQVEVLQKQWEVDQLRLETNAGVETDKTSEAIRQARQRSEEITALLGRQQHSLFAWLQDNKPGWEQSIGKVIDQSQVLFHPGLSPRLTSQEVNSIFGVELNLAELSGNVKNLADYEAEQQELERQILRLQGRLKNLAEDLALEQEKLKRKYQPLILALKEKTGIREYELQKAESEAEQAALALASWQHQATETQSQELQALKAQMHLAREEKQKTQEHRQQVERNLLAQKEARKKEKNQKLKQAQADLHARLAELDQAVTAQRSQAAARTAEIAAQSKNALGREGADTPRLGRIEAELQAIAEELHFIEANRDRVAEYNQDKRELFDLVDAFKADKKRHETRLMAEEQNHDQVKARLQEKAAQARQQLAAASAVCSDMQQDLEAFDVFRQTEVWQQLAPGSQLSGPAPQLAKRLTTLIRELNDKSFGLVSRLTSLRADVSKFLSYFSASNIFGFKTNLIDNPDYLDFAENLKEFLEEDKIAEYEKRGNEHFASLIRQIGKDTNELVSKEAEIQKVIGDINRDFEERNFAGVIKNISLRLSESANKLVVLLQQIRAFHSEHGHSLGAANLFSTGDPAAINQKAVSLLKSFSAEIAGSRQQEVNLSDTFELEFRILENDNDSGWVEKLANVGSEGTDILVKAMINIMLLNVFKESASKRFRDFRLHCMMDEIGKLHPNNVKGILKFANDRNILLINSSPTSYNAMDYRYTYLLSKDARNVTTVKKLVKNLPVNELA